MKDLQAQHTTAPLLLTVDEACRELHISKFTLYGLFRSGKLRKIKVGTATRVPRSELERWIDDQLAGEDQVDEGGS